MDTQILQKATNPSNDDLSAWIYTSIVSMYIC